MNIRKPDNPLTAPNTVILKMGAVLERVHNRKFKANSFNPCLGNPTRFAPIKDKNGHCVPSLYAGETFEAAVFETIFHDVPAKAKRKRVPKKKVEETAQGRLETKRDLTLVSLREPDLKRWRIKRAQLIATSPKVYLQTAAWAEAIHHQFPNVDGLEWTSNQCDPATAYLFFGDRVQASDFSIMYTRDGLTDPTFLQEVRQIGRRSDIRITV
jgi:hypothetical protein